MKDLTKLREIQRGIQTIRASSIWHDLETINTTIPLLEARADLLRAHNKLDKVYAVLKINNILSEKEIQE